MALSTVFKRLSKVAKLGGTSKVVSTTSRLGSRSSEVLGALAGKKRTISKAASMTKGVVKNTAADAGKARKVLTPRVVNKASTGSSIRKASSKVIKGAGVGGLIALPLAAGGYGLSKIGGAIGQVRQGFTGASPEDLASSRLGIIEEIIGRGENPADYGFTEQNLPSGVDGADSPQYLFGGEQPRTTEAPPSVAGQISQVILIGGAVAAGLFLVKYFTKKKKVSKK